MIASFKDKETANVFMNEFSKLFQSIRRTARRKLVLIQAANCLADLSIPPNNHLEPLVGNRAGQHSIRINDQWRICFIWYEGNAHDVEIVDYH